MKFALRRGMAGEVSPHGHTVSGAHLSFGFHSRKDTRASSYFDGEYEVDYCAGCGRPEDMCTCYELTCSFCGQPVDNCTCWMVDPNPEPEPDPDWDIYCPTCGFVICQCCLDCHTYPCDCEPEGGDGTDTDEGEYEDTDQGGGGNPPSFDNTPLTPENFLDKIISTRLMVKFQKYNINYKSIKLVVDTKTTRNQTNAAFDATNNTITIYNNMFASNFTRTDMESILFHEFIHYRDFVNKGDLPRNVDGYVVKKTYMVHCTPFELEWTYNSCMKDAISSNLPNG